MSDCEKKSKSFIKYSKIVARKLFFFNLMMQYIQGIALNQLRVCTLEDTINQYNPVRFIEAFVNSIELDKIGFKLRVLKTEGRPSFDTKVFLKIYLYGYLNGIRSSYFFENKSNYFKIYLGLKSINKFLIR